MENRSGKRWTLEEDALLLSKPVSVVAKLTGRTRYAVGDRRRFMEGNRQARKFPAPHSCDPHHTLHRMSNETHIPIKRLRDFLRTKVETGKLPPPAMNNKGEYDWKVGWENPAIYQKAKGMALAEET